MVAPTRGPGSSTACSAVRTRTWRAEWIHDRSRSGGDRPGTVVTSASSIGSVEPGPDCSSPRAVFARANSDSAGCGPGGLLPRLRGDRSISIRPLTMSSGSLRPSTARPFMEHVTASAAMRNRCGITRSPDRERTSAKHDTEPNRSEEGVEPRNEGVAGSSPAVGLSGLQGFLDSPPARALLRGGGP